MVGGGDWAIAAGYFAYFGAIGIFQPFFPVHLAALGLSAFDIGLVLAVWNALRVLSPLGIAWFADRHADRRPLLAAFACAGALAALALVGARSLGALALGIGCLSLCLNGLMPVYDTHTLERLGERAHHYGRLRLWGSVGFVATSVGLGFVAARVGSTAIVWAFFGFVTLTALAVLALPVAGTGARVRADLGEFGVALRRRPVILFLLVCFLHLAGFGGYYGFYSLYLVQQGYGPGAVGLFWAVGVLAEIVLFAFVPRLVKRYPLTRLLGFALAATVLRWLMVAAFPGIPALMLGAQLLHFAGFGIFHAVTVLMGPRLMPAGTAARAQALVSSLGWGAGGTLGSLLAGGLWEKLGPRAVFVGGAVLAAAAWLVASRGLAACFAPAPGPAD